MNILEQLNLARKHLMFMPKVTTLDDLDIGEKFEFASHKPLNVGDMIYICNPPTLPYGRAIITNNPSEALFEAKRTS